MTSPRHAELAARLLREAVNVEPPPTSAEVRAEAIAKIERAIHLRRARARRARVGGALAVAATLVFAVGAAWKVSSASSPQAADHVLRGAPIAQASELTVHPIGEGGFVLAAGREEPLGEGDTVPLKAGTRVETRPGGRLLLSFATGTNLELAQSGDLEIVEQGRSEIYALSHGTLDLSVAKVKHGDRFLVRTGDAEIEVRGTHFHVAVVDPASACGASTRVSVDEGVVVVRSGGAETRVAAGEAWPTCERAAASPPASVTLPEPPRAPSAPAAEAPLAVEAPPAPAPPPGSTLADQNDLFADAIAHKHRGEDAAASAAFNRFLAKYPNSPLSESAAAERLKILRASDPVRARAAAKEYLARWPSGFASAEAEAVLQGSP